MGDHHVQHKAPSNKPLEPTAPTRRNSKAHFHSQRSKEEIMSVIPDLNPMAARAKAMWMAGDRGAADHGPE
jgi:hypothetical protein